MNGLLRVHSIQLIKDFKETKPVDFPACIVWHLKHFRDSFF